MECVLETGVRMGADIVFIQEPTIGKDSTMSHPAYILVKSTDKHGRRDKGRTWTAIRKNTKWQLEQRGDLETTESLGDVQVWDATGPSGRKVRLVNVYSQDTSLNGSTIGRPAHRARWLDILGEGNNLIIAGDINAHSPVWNSRCQRN